MVNLATHLVPRLGMSGVIPLLSLYAIIAWTGTNSVPLQCILPYLLRHEFRTLKNNKKMFIYNKAKLDRAVYTEILRGFPQSPLQI